MTPQETAWLTDAMVKSGVRVDLSGIPGLKVDKHSTGGVGDKTSLILAPVAAACGLPVPMMSGRGLGHTGGTLDKLESIPGFSVRLSLEEMLKALEKTGCAMIGQTDQIAPADRKLYAARRSGTIEHPAHQRVNHEQEDRRRHRRARARRQDGQRRLHEDGSRFAAARRITRRDRQGVGRPDAGDHHRHGRASLGRAVGNSVEVIECIESMRGQEPADLMEVTMALTVPLLVLGRVAKTPADARKLAQKAIDSGEALDRFRRIIEVQGGDPHVVDDVSRLPQVKQRHLVQAPRSGYLARMDAELIGRASVALGAGRDRVEDAVDPAVGIIVNAKPGAKVNAGETVLDVLYRDKARLDTALDLIKRAIVIEDKPPAPRPLVVGEVR
jgi:thymidine phosphorylase